jgi:hypothetical protein
MALQAQTVSVAFGSGMDSKTDPKVTAKPVLLKDCIFTSPHRVSKRPGYDPMALNILFGGTITSPTMDKSYKNELVLAGTNSSVGNRLFGYSSAVGAWVDKGKYVSVKVTKDIIAAPSLGPAATVSPNQQLGVINSSSAIIGNVICYGYDNGTSLNGTGLPFAATQVNWALYDNETGTRLAGSHIFSAYGTTWGFSKVVALGATQFAIFYISDTSSVSPTAPRLCYKTISINSGGVTLGSEVVVATCKPNSGNFYVYDVVTTSSGCFGLCVNQTAMIPFVVNTSGALTSGTPFFSTGVLTPLTITLDTAGTNAWIYWVSAGATLFSAVYNASTAAVVASNTSIQTSLSNVSQVAALAVSTTEQTLFLSELTQPAAAFTIGVYFPEITQQEVFLSGSSITAGAAGPFKNGLDIYGKPFTADGASYIPLVNLSQSQSTGFIVDVSDGVAVSKFLQTEAEGIYGSEGNTTGTTYQAPFPISFRYPGFLSPMLSFSSTIFGFAAGFVVSLATIATSESSPANKSAYPNLFTDFAQLGIALIQFDFDNIAAYQGLIQQDTLVLNGGIVSQYDGSQVSELGFNIDPDAVSLISSATAGGLGVGTYEYFAVYSWTDANGNLHQSAPSLAASIVFTSGTTNSVEVGVAPLTLTQKSNVVINVYRTGPNGTIAYLVGSLISGSTWASFIDSNSFDAGISVSPSLYTQGGAILENIAPPPAMVLWTNNNRLWAIDSESPETNIEPSKTASSGSGIAFSTGQLTVVIDSKYGEISGASPMDEKTVILKENGLGFFVGDAANDAGGGSTINGFQFIPSDAGCSNSNSVVLYPGGILFRASNNKGIYQVSRGAQVSYFGQDVEAYNSQDIRSSFINPNKNQIRFLTSSGSSLVYDYVMNQWGVFTNHAGLSADQFNGLYVYVRTDGSVYLENDSSFLDNTTPYAQSVLLQWIKSSSAQNYQRVRRVELLGDYQNGSSSGHGVQISEAVDFGTTFSTPIPYLFGAPSSSGAYQYREGLPIQKCNAIQLLIQEIVTGASGEYIDFTDLGLEIGTKQGLNKLPASRSV